MINCKRVGEDWATWEMELASRFIQTVRAVSLSRPSKGRSPLRTEIIVLGRGDGGRTGSEWSIMTVERTERARISQTT